MLRLVIPALAIAVFAAAIMIQRSPSPTAELSTATAAMPSLQELHVAAEVHKLPILDMEDQSLIFPTREHP
jgi:hypothetical protein